MVQNMVTERKALDTEAEKKGRGPQHHLHGAGTRLPHDMQLEVMRWLPYKSLLRFCGVNKTWDSLITKDSHFIHSQAMTPASLKYQKLILFDHDYVYDLNFKEDMSATKNDDQLKVLKTGFQKPLKLVGHLDVLATCDNRLLLQPGSMMTSFLLFDACTQTFEELPRYNSRDPREFLHELMGICYDDNAGVYHVITLLKYGCKNRLARFNFKDNSWVDDFGDLNAFIECDGDKQGFSINGAPHWVCRLYGDGGFSSYRRVILRFDMAGSGKLMELKPPKEPHLVWCDSFHLASMNGKLCVYSDSFTNLDVWMMREYGVQDSWLKLYSIPPPMQWEVYSMKPLAFTRSGAVVVIANGRYMFVYNPDKKTCTALASFPNFIGSSLGTYSTCSGKGSPFLSYA